MYECISDDVESYEEYSLVYNLTKIFLDKAITDGIIPEDVVTLLSKQLPVLDNRVSRIAHYVFMDDMNLEKRTTCSNEVRHRNMKYGLNCIQPNFQLPRTAQRLINNTFDSTCVHLKRIAQNLTQNYQWNEFHIPVPDLNQRHALAQLEQKNNYYVMRSSHVLWHVLRKKLTLDVQNFHHHL